MAKKKKLLLLLKRLLLKHRLRWKLLRWKLLRWKLRLLKLRLLKLRLLNPPSNSGIGNEKPACWPVFLRLQKLIEPRHGFAQTQQGLGVGKTDMVGREMVAKVDSGRNRDTCVIQ